MSEKMSPQINELAKALVQVQAVLKPAIKDSANPFFKSKYADLSSVWDAARAPLTQNGLAVIQTTNGDDPDTVTIVTTLVHTSGQWIQGSLRMKPAKNDPQGVGSAITYARRYALAAIVGICPEDDDGEASMDRSKMSNVQKREINPVTNKPRTNLSEPVMMGDNRPQATLNVIRTFMGYYEALKSLSGPDAYKEFLRGKSGESPSIEDIQKFDTPKQISWLNMAIPKIQKRINDLKDMQKHVLEDESDSIGIREAEAIMRS